MVTSNAELARLEHVLDEKNRENDRLRARLGHNAKGFEALAITVNHMAKKVRDFHQVFFFLKRKKFVTVRFWGLNKALASALCGKLRIFWPFSSCLSPFRLFSRLKWGNSTGFEFRNLEKYD